MFNYQTLIVVQIEIKDIVRYIYQQFIGNEATLKYIKRRFIKLLCIKRIQIVSQILNGKTLLGVRSKK